MHINLVADASVSSAPAGFVAAIEAAAQIYENDFPGNYTANLRFGWGTFDDKIDSLLTGVDISYGGVENFDYNVSYATVKSWLNAAAILPVQTAAYASLPASSASLPNGANALVLSSAEEKALGVYTGASDTIDGAMGFGTITGRSEWESLALCEIGHALGWLTQYYAGAPTVLDLFRYESPGQMQWTGGQPAYFSTDDGKTDLANFATSFDYTLFANLSGDAFSAGGSPAAGLASLDLEMLDLLGFAGKPDGPALSIANAYAMPGSATEIVSGTIDAADAGLAITIYDGATAIGSATADAAGDWTAAVSLGAGAHVLTAQATNTAGTPGVSAAFDLTRGGSQTHTDTAANLAALTAAAIASLANSGVAELTASDATVHFNQAQSAAIEAAGLSVSAPANRQVREGFAGGSSLLFDFDARDALYKVVTGNADGSFDARYLNAPGVNHGVSYASYSVAFNSSDARVQETFYNASDDAIADLTFTSDGFSLYVAGQLTLTRTNNGGGSFDVRHYGRLGSVAGSAYDSVDVTFSSTGAAVAENYYSGSAEVAARTNNADGTFEIQNYNVTGQAYTSFQNDFSAGGLVAHSLDFVSGGGQLNLFGSGLSVSSSGSIRPAPASFDFWFNPNVGEIYVLQPGAANDRLNFAAGFGSETVKGFGAASASTDVVNISNLFANYQAAMSGMTLSGSSAVFADSSGDSLTLTGVAAADLTASRLGFA